MASYSVAPPVALQLGSFDWPCAQLALPMCPLLGAAPVEPLCYSRNIDIAGFLLFEPAALVIHIIALIMTAIMIFHIKSKYTAVGRKEIVLFFYLYAATTIFEFFVVSGIIPPASVIFPYVAAAHISVSMATLWSLFFNGFVPFGWVEDGTPFSLWSLRISSAIVLAASYFVAIATFKSVAGLSAANPVLLWTIYYIFGGVFVSFYVISQIVVVFTRLEDQWALADISLGVVFFIMAQIVNYVVSSQICTVAQHYVDGFFFGTIATLLSVMMVYKYWDTITKEDLEFAVGGKGNNWEINDPLLGDSAMAAMSSKMEFYDDPSQEQHQPPSQILQHQQ